MATKQVKYFMRLLGAKMSTPDNESVDSRSSKTQQDHIKQLILKKITAQSEKSNKEQIMGAGNANQHNQFLLNEQAERFENLNARFQKNKIISKKNEVLKFLLECAGTADPNDEGGKKGTGINFNQENITKALMGTMLKDSSRSNTDF